MAHIKKKKKKLIKKKMLAGLCSLQSLQGSFCFTSFSQLLMSLAIPGAFDLVGVCVCVC